MKLWHYTTAFRIPEIIESGEIRTSNANATGNREVPTLWLSSNPIWENTATKYFNDGFNRYPLTKEQQHERFGLGRIEVNTQTISYFTWHTFVKNIAAKRHIARGMEESGRKSGGNPKQWFGSTKPIGTEHFLSAEIWDGNEWKVVKTEF